MEITLGQQHNVGEKPTVILYALTLTATRFSLSMEMSRLTRGDGTAEPVSRDQILRHARGQGNMIFSCSADHEQDWQPSYYPVDPYSAICDDHTYIHTLILIFPLSYL